MGQYTFQRLRTIIGTRLFLRENESGVAIIARQKAESNAFQRLPPKLIQIILKLLSGADEICFALSNSAIYTCFQEYIRHYRPIGDDRWHPAYINPSLTSEGRLSKRHKASFGSKYRAELLLRLGDKRSVYCGQCHNVHKRSIGRALQSYFNLKPQCSSLHTEVVDICPCTAMTFHNTRNCIIVARTPELQGFYRNYWRCSEPSFRCETGKTEFTHQCTFNDHSLAIVYIKTRVWFDEGSKSLQVQSLFKFDVSGLKPAQLKHLGKSNINNCIHHDAARWLQKFFQESKAPVDMKILGSDYCQWLGWEESKADESPRSFEIILHRDLGGVHWPDKRWMNCSHTRLRPPRARRDFLTESHLQ
jgi:hypothetical protein